MWSIESSNDESSCNAKTPMPESRKKKIDEHIKRQETRLSISKNRLGSTTETTTMTDSGVTHTIPNNSIVTVTKHTTITTGRIITATSSDLETVTFRGSFVIETTTSNATPTTSSAEAVGGSPGDEGFYQLPSGAIAGIAVGSAMMLAMVAVFVFTWIRRHRNRGKEIGPGLVNNDNIGGFEDKHFPQLVSAHTTGTQGSSDPFAPFGGRVDQPEQQHSEFAEAIEMDGTSSAPVELPAISVSRPSTSTRKAPRLDTVEEAISTDLRANLTSMKNEVGQSAHVNHWNQYKHFA